ncbi:DUF1772 domain-containing protein [Prauserella muralis]|uniref:Uncharacterized protein n=1 Tax=Prauserella muralis TaxID=588067 RepID=A0A2V4AIM0_9PSEU|nr:anthrone oxygenase family protein [Prauserella muralis]PXY19420.1 hypothetical protein BAY60_32270 [Prauserella muralis]TWE29393.1 putative membrane protein [Prauserella muralis]
MTNGVFLAVALAAALGSGLIAGVFFAFSAFVMRALARLPAAQGIAAMQSINVTVLGPAFLTVFVGTALLSLVAVVLALVWWAGAGSGWALTGGLLYVAGTVGLTRVVHIPRNEALARVAAGSDSGRAYWTRYLREWTAWNHVRTVAALAACASLVLAMANR